MNKTETKEEIFIRAISVLTNEKFVDINNHKEKLIKIGLFDKTGYLKEKYGGLGRNE